MESRNIILMNLSAGQWWRHRLGEHTCGHSGGRKGWEELREQHGNIYITLCKTVSQWELATGGSSNPVLCDHLEGWDGDEGGRET